MRRKRTDLEKLQSAYSKADFALRNKVRELFPYGSEVRCRLTGWSGVVQPGSLYADNVKTERGHMSISFLELVTKGTDDDQ